MAGNNSGSSTKLWAGRFSMDTAQLLDLINSSIDYDIRMWRQDIAGSCAWADGLADAQIISAQDRDAIVKGLHEIGDSIESGTFEPDRALEDIHMNIEHALTVAIGDTGKRLHTGRSRNDQVCTDFRLYVRESIDGLIDELSIMISYLCDTAALHTYSLIPGYTHLQRAQPVSLGYHLMAWATSLLEDVERLLFARKMTNRSPLGSAALAGSAYPVDRDAIATALGFERPLPNGMMAVADRGFAQDTLHALSMLAVHCSRIGEEIILWNSQEFQRIALSDAWSTGSSIMPQKKNPDVAELLRGKAGRIFGAYQTLAVVQKGLSYAYNKDLQEDKEPVFDAIDNMVLMIKSMHGMLSQSEWLIPDEADVVGKGHLMATELADYLVRQGVPFRDAHEAVGKAVALAEDRKAFLADLDLADYQSLHPKFGQSLFEALQPAVALARRDVVGGTAPNRVLEAIEWTRSELARLAGQAK